jgi:cellobiose-specific phosphotransferase system component IIA
MAIKQEEALELMKFLNLEEAADLEAAKEKFQENCLNLHDRHLFQDSCIHHRPSEASITPRLIMLR